MAIGTGHGDWNGDGRTMVRCIKTITLLLLAILPIVKMVTASISVMVQVMVVIMMMGCDDGV